MAVDPRFHDIKSSPRLSTGPKSVASEPRMNCEAAAPCALVILSEAKDLSTLQRSFDSLALAQDDATVSDRCEASPLALGQLRHLTMPTAFIVAPRSVSDLNMNFA